MVILSEDVHVVVTYLGTHHTLFTALPPDSREVNYELTDAELAKVSAIIKASQASAGHIPVVLSVNGRTHCGGMWSFQLELCQYPEPRLLDTETAVPMVEVTVSLITSSPSPRSSSRWL